MHNDDLSRTTRVLLVRHGEGKLNVDGMIGGLLGCTGLTERGRHQARLLSERWAGTGFGPDVILSSRVRRVRETADILAAGYEHTSVVEDGDLCELYLGEADVLSWEEYDRRYGRFSLVAEPSRPFAPEAECWNDATARIRQWFGEVTPRFGDQAIVAVTHAGLIVAPLIELLGVQPSTERGGIDPRFTSITTWRSHDAHWALQCFNDVAHLERGISAATDHFTS